MQTNYYLKLDSYYLIGEFVQCNNLRMIQLDSLSQSELASRLTLNCVDGYVSPQKLQHLPTMIIDVRYLTSYTHTCSMLSISL